MCLIGLYLGTKYEVCGLHSIKDMINCYILGHDKVTSLKAGISFDPQYFLKPFRVRLKICE